jgi:hypothetical protein
MKTPTVRPYQEVIRTAHPLITQFEKLGFKEDERKLHFEKTHKGKKAVNLAAEQVSVQNALEYLDSLHKILQAEFDAIRMRLLPDAMEEEHLASPMTVNGVGRVTLTPDLQVSIKAEEKDHFYGWLRKKKFGDLITEGINSSTLKAFCKGRIEDGKDLPGEMLNLSPITRASITRAK